jgi:1-deoxy-D-xylulose-5-phosphate reductoisomerase
MSEKRVAVLGSTGSVGTQALDVVRRHPDRLKVASLAAGVNVELMVAQAREFRPPLLCMADEGSANAVREALDESTIEVVHGDDGLMRATTDVDADTVLNAVVGAAGLAATDAAVRNGTDVALANKESLVMAGELIMAAAREHDVAILPVDSEPNALHQCLRGERLAEVHRLILTASGGPFRGWSAEQLADVTAEGALAHPTWKMGPRITIDSATLMNKGFEVIETHWLFGLPAEKIDVVVHPQSIVHSLVEMVDGSLIAHAGPTDMRLPIQDALSYPERWERAVDALDLPASGPWNFEPADRDRYPALGLARDALARGGTAAAALNASDEVAVAAFLGGQLAFDRIVPLVAEVMETVDPAPLDDLESVFRTDRAARAETERRLQTS